MRFGQNFLLRVGGPIDTRLTHLNRILLDLFRDTPFDYIWHAKMCASNTVFSEFGCIWARFQCPKYGQVADVPIVIFFSRPNSIITYLTYGICPYQHSFMR